MIHFDRKHRGPKKPLESAAGRCAWGLVSEPLSAEAKPGGWDGAQAGVQAGLGAGVRPGMLILGLRVLQPPTLTPPPASSTA